MELNLVINKKSYKITSLQDIAVIKKSQKVLEKLSTNFRF